MCGENQLPQKDNFAIRGSPPRVRGKRVAELQVFRVSGITPACAGKTVIAQLSEPDKRDHPRVCGENSIEAFIWSTAAGSPPRVRGKP